MVRVQTPVRMQNGKDFSVELWIETESYKIAWSGAYTQSEKSENFIYFQDLYKLIEPADSEPQTSSTVNSTQVSAYEKKPETSQSIRTST